MAAHGIDHAGTPTRAVRTSSPAVSGPVYSARNCCAPRGRSRHAAKRKEAKAQRRTPPLPGARTQGHSGTWTGGCDGMDSLHGYIEREGSLGLVQPEFRAVVAALHDQVAHRFGGRLHSAYLYGSVPRGTARVGRSDLDVLLALHEDPTDADRADARNLEAELDAGFEAIDGAGILLYGRDVLLSELERFDLGWFVACLCTPLLGDDLAEHLPRYRPTSLLARETNGDLGD